MKIPSLRQIISSDFPAQFKQLMDQVGILFNGGLNPLYQALNNNLTFGDNFNATVIQLNVTVDSSGNPIQKVTFKLNSNQTTISGILVLNAFGANNGAITPTGGIFATFNKNGSNVNITNLTGLAPSVLYTIKVVAFS